MELFKQGDFVVRLKEDFTKTWLRACEEAGVSPESPKRVISLNGGRHIILAEIPNRWRSWCFSKCQPEIKPLEEFL